MLPEVRMARIVEAIGQHRARRLSCLQAAELLGVSERQERAVGVRHLVGTRIEEVEDVQLQPAVAPSISGPSIDGAPRRPFERPILRQGSRANIAVFERAKPTRLFSYFHSSRCNNAHGLRDEVTRRVTYESEIRERGWLEKIKPG